MNITNTFRQKTCNARHLKLRTFLYFSPRGMVSATSTDLKGESFKRSIAGPDKTGWVAHACTSVAPFSNKTLAAAQIVPAVSIISSTKIAIFPSTSPITWVAVAWFGRSRRLSIIARPAFTFLQNFWLFPHRPHQEKQ